MKTRAGWVEIGGPNVRWTAGLAEVCPLDVIVADEAPGLLGLTSKSSPTLLVILSRSGSDLTVESKSEGSAYLLSDGGSAFEYREAKV